MAAIGGHHRGHKGASNEWLTPPGMIRALGQFDLDPCSPVNRPWDTARKHFTIVDDGMSQRWEGRVWLNPPYGPETGKWLERLSEHDGGGVALVFARTETRPFQQFVWGRADGLLFIAGRLHFHYPSGQKAASNSGGPSVLVAYGSENVQALRDSGIPGALVELAGNAGSFRILNQKSERLE